MPNNKVLTDEQRSTLESLARTSTPYEQEVLRSILAAHPGQPEPADCGETLPGEYTNADDLIASLREPEPRECRHCGWMCIPNSTPSKTWYPLPQPEPRAEVTFERWRDSMSVNWWGNVTPIQAAAAAFNAARAQGGDHDQ